MANVLEVSKRVIRSLPCPGRTSPRTSKRSPRPVVTRFSARAVPDVAVAPAAYAGGMLGCRKSPLVAGLSVLAGYAALLRPRMLRWGATDEERAGCYPGADIVRGGRRTATMAVTIEAPPLRVWPWLVQMGFDRAGWYSWDHLDRGGIPSEERIHAEWQNIAIGDRLASAPDAGVWFEVAALEPLQFLALRASLELAPRMRPFDPRGQRPRFYSDSTWCFLLTELPGARTRLVVSGYASSRPRPLTAIADFVFWEPAHWIMQTRQFANLKRRSESSERSPTDRERDSGVGATPVDTAPIEARR